MSKYKTQSKTSPKDKSRACLCDDGTYSKECCDGTIYAQGIGSMYEGNNSAKTQTIVERTITRDNG